MKSPWQSKTIWVNGLTLAGSVLAMLSGSELIAAHPGLVSAIGIGLAVVNLALRFVTTEGIDLSA